MAACSRTAAPLADAGSRATDRGSSWPADRVGDPADLQYTALSPPSLHRFCYGPAVPALGALHIRRRIVGSRSPTIPPGTGSQRTADPVEILRTTRRNLGRV